MQIRNYGSYSSEIPALDDCRQPSSSNQGSSNVSIIYHGYPHHIESIVTSELK